MAADAGAQQILNLLATPSQLLHDNSLLLLKAQRKQVDKPYGVMPQYGVDALNEIRTFYRNLRAQIDAIQTVDTASKASVLEGLDTLDRSIGSYERSLEFGMSNPAIPRAKKAKKRAKQANASLKDALQGLQQ
jgi:hypothetical protein